MDTDKQKLYQSNRQTAKKTDRNYLRHSCVLVLIHRCPSRRWSLWGLSLQTSPSQVGLQAAGPVLQYLNSWHSASLCGKSIAKGRCCENSHPLEPVWPFCCLWNLLWCPVILPWSTLMKLFWCTSLYFDCHLSVYPVWVAGCIHGIKTNKKNHIFHWLEKAITTCRVLNICKMLPSHLFKRISCFHHPSQRHPKACWHWTVTPIFSLRLILVINLAEGFDEAAVTPHQIPEGTSHRGVRDWSLLEMHRKDERCFISLP